VTAALSAADRLVLSLLQLHELAPGTEVWCYPTDGPWSPQYSLRAAVPEGSAFRATFLRVDVFAEPGALVTVQDAYGVVSIVAWPAWLVDAIVEAPVDGMCGPLSRAAVDAGGAWREAFSPPLTVVLRWLVRVLPGRNP